MPEPSSIHSVHDSIVIRIAKIFGIEAHGVTPAGGGFSGASVFRVESKDGQVFAIRKTSAAAALPEARLRALHHLLRAVSRQGVSIVPVPIEPLRHLIHHPHESGALIPEESWVKSGSDLWQAEPWMPGAPADSQLRNEQLQSALQWLHLFHEAAGRSVSTVSPTPWFFLTTGASPGVNRRLMIAKELSDFFLKTLKAAMAMDPDPEFRGLALRICEALGSWLPWLVARLTQVSNQSFRLQPVLRDVWRAHMLFTENEVTGLIDFSAAATDHVCVDLSRLFRSWFASDAQRIREAAAQFSVLRPLDKNEWTLLEAFDAATVLLSPVTWLRRRIESGDRTSSRPDILIRLSELTKIAEQFRPLSG